MITRSKMRRQLYRGGGITRQRYGLGDLVRKLIPNEIADVAVKAAPFVAPFFPGTAALMRGIGRFDQRGSLSDAFKQGIGTYAGGKLFGAGMEKIGLRDPGAKGIGEFFGEGTRSKAKTLFKGEDMPTVGKEKTGPLKNVAEKTFENVPFSDKISTKVKEKLLVGGITSGVSALYSYFTGEFEPQEAGESLEEYMARRKERVKSQMRQVMDSYYTPLRNPEYAAMSDEQKDNFIDGIVGQGLAAGGMPTGIMRTNKAGVMERDYRDKGGFVPVGIKEKADDVPAMLSKNEFVMTADAVRGAGNGSIEKGAQRMYDTMKRLEKRVR